MHLKNILSPFDGSETSARAINYAIDLCILGNASIIFVHVLDNIKQGGVIGLRARYGDTKLVEGYKNARKNDMIKWIKPIEYKAQKQNINTQVIILEDEKNSKVETLIDFIEDNNIDMVVMGSRGLSNFKQMLVGSLASGILSHSKCPVLIIR